MRTIHTVDQVGSGVVISIREYNGIERADYTDLDTLDIEQARELVNSLNKAINAAVDFAEDARQKRMKSLEQEIEMRIDELKKLKQG